MTKDTTQTDDLAAASLPASVELHGITIHKLTLSETVQALKYMKDVPKLFSILNVAGDDQETMLNVALPVIADFMPDALEVLAIAARVDKQVLDEKLNLAQAIECFIAIFKVNDFLALGGSMSKMLPQKGGKSGQKN